MHATGTGAIQETHPKDNGLARPLYKGANSADSADRRHSIPRCEMTDGIRQHFVEALVAAGFSRRQAEYLTRYQGEGAPWNGILDEIQRIFYTLCRLFLDQVEERRALRNPTHLRRFLHLQAPELPPPASPGPRAHSKWHPEKMAKVHGTKPSYVQTSPEDEYARMLAQGEVDQVLCDVSTM